MRIVLVHEYLNQYGGAERVLKAFTEIFPEAEIFTLFYDEEMTKGMFSDRIIHTSFLQKIPFVKSHHKRFTQFMSIAWEDFSFDDYNIVLSSSHSFAKGIIVPPSTFHICYCHTPMRWAWEEDIESKQYLYFGKLFAKYIIPFILSYYRMWDQATVSRVDSFLANSQYVASRIKKYYRRDANVLHPPLDWKNFFIKEDQNYFVMVGRLVPYKEFEIGIKACNELGIRLKIVGEGSDRKRLEKIAKNNVEFLGWVSNEKLREIYACASGLLFPQIEDFGIVPLEAMASGKPVIAYYKGGALEIVRENFNGIFFHEQTVESCVNAVKKFQKTKFDPQGIRASVEKFDVSFFKKRLKEIVFQEYMDYIGSCAMDEKREEFDKMTRPLENLKYIEK